MEKTPKPSYAAAVGRLSPRGDLEEQRGRSLSGHRVVASGSISHYLCDFDALSTHIFQSQYTRKPLQKTTLISVMDSGDFVFEAEAHNRHQLHNFVRAIMQAHERFNVLHAIAGKTMIDTHDLSAEAESMTVESFDKLWASIQESPLFKLYHHEKAFYKAFSAEGGFNEAFYLSDLNQCLEEDDGFLDTSAKQQYWSSFLLQCKGISEERDRLILSLTEKLAEFFKIDVEALIAVSMGEDSLAACGRMEEDVEATEQEGAVGYTDPIVVDPFTPERQPFLKMQGSVMDESFSQLRLEDTPEETPQRVNPERSRAERKKAFKAAKPKVMKGERKKTRVDQQEDESKFATKHSKRNSIDIVSVLQMTEGQPESAHVCHKGKHDFYVCKLLENDANKKHAANFLETMNVYELRLDEIFKWIGSSEAVFRWYGKERVRLGRDNLKPSTVAEVRYYIDKYKSHPLRAIHRANISLFNAVLEKPKSVQYCTGQLRRAVKDYFSKKEIHYFLNQGEGLCNFYQDVVDWCRHNQPGMSDDQMHYLIAEFNESLKELQLPGKVHADTTPI